MKQDQIETNNGTANPYKTDDDQLAKKHLNDTRKPSITLKTLNKLRKMKELRKFDLLKQQEFISHMYAAPVEQI